MLLRKRIPMSTGLKVSSLACKCIFYKPEHNAKGEPHGIEIECEIPKWNIPMDRAQKVDEKNESFA